MSARAAIMIAAIIGAGCGGAQNALNPAGPQARSIATLTWWFFGVCAVVYVLVIAAIIWAIARRRQPADDSPATSRRLTLTVAGATVATVVALIALSVSSVVTGRGLTAPSGPGAITIDAVGHQWWWEFVYHDVTPSDRVTSPNELHIPVGVPVAIKATSRDVIHSFWVPTLHGKRDLVPGMVTHTWIQADTPGIYRGQCSEFCGHQHANMAFVVVAQPMEEFRAWLAAQRRPAPPPETADLQRGHAVFMTGPCVVCHTIRGTDAGSRVGPELTHVASRQTLAAGTLPNTREHLARWVRNAQSIKPGSRMPPVPLSEGDMNALLLYLETLK